LTPSTTKPYYACPHEECLAINEPPAIKTATGYALPDGMPLAGSGVEGGYTPEELRSAYNIPKTGGKEPEQQTVAVVDAYYDSTAESDLAEYRKEYKLGECRKSNGCFKWFNQQGEEVKEKETGKETREGWGIETSLDLDMVSAACPECHILLVEANAKGAANLGPSVNKAVELGATEVSNSYGLPEDYEPWCGKTGCAQYSSDYDHPEYENSKHEKYPVVITASAGDYGYDNYLFGEGVSLPDFPATTPSVIAVGGTALHIEKSARTSETVWSETGSGCSRFESTKTTGQKETEEKEGRKGCTSDRTDNDVAADASCATPVSLYDSAAFKKPEHSGWSYECGTSVASPLVAGIEAHASKHTRSLGANAFYKKPSMLFHVSEGSNGECGTESEPKWYLCHATKEGYNGPAAMGTPNGVFASTAAPTVTTGSAMSVTETEATLHGTVNPNGTEAKYYFEYGTSTSYGSQTAEVSAGSGESSVEVSKAITNLTAGKEYDYRIVATNSNKETSDGSNQVFMTHPYWSFQSTPNPTGATGSYFFGGTSCTASNACTAVGAYFNSSGKEVPLVERWNGTEWSIQSTPSSSEQVEYEYLGGVSCTSSEACTAVGFAYSKGEITLAERWNGKEWSVQSMPSLQSGAHLSGVSCTSAAACTAVGMAGEGIVAEGWNGTGWSIQEVPSPVGATGFTEPMVSCTSSSACTLTGSYKNSSGTKVTLAERWNGTVWSIQTTPDPAEAKSSTLRGVSCTSSETCTAVGEYSTSSGGLSTLAESWNGKEWAIQSTPNNSKKSNDKLWGVSCISSTACTAVGGEEEILAEGWNGKEWSIQKPANPTGSLRGRFYGISCISSNICFASGYYESSSETAVTLAERYE
jgi:hypothetical protein